LPDVAGGLQRAGVPADLLAGFRSPRARGCDPRIPPARAPLRRSRGAHRIVGVTGDAAPGRTSDGLRLRVVSAVVRGPLAIAAALAGGGPFAAFWGVAATLIVHEWLTITAAGRAAVAAGVVALVAAAALAIVDSIALAGAALACGAAAIALLAASER